MGLREDTIARIRTEGNFDMDHFAPPDGCGTACCIAGNILLAAGIPLEPYNGGIGIPILARQLWANAYGEDEARRLEFNSAWGPNLEEVTPEEAIAHLNGADPIVHGSWDDPDDRDD